MDFASGIYVRELDGEYTAAYGRCMDVGAELQKLMTRRDWSQEVLAGKLGTTQATVSRWLKGQDPKGKTREKIDALLAAEAETEPPEELKRVPLGREFEPDPEFNALPRRAVSAEHRAGLESDEIPQAETLGLGLRDAGDQVNIDIGNGSSVIGVPVLDTWRVPGTVLRRRVSAPINMLHFVECEGNSMKPLISDGDVVLVDRSKRNPTMPGIFALWEGDGQTIKQVEIIRGSQPPKLRLIPANKDYAAYEVLAEDVHIIGRYVARFTVD